MRCAAADSLALAEPGTQSDPLMGDFNATPRSQAGRTVTGERFFTPFTESERRGYGSYVYRDRRLLYDFIMMSHNLREVPKAEQGQILNCISEAPTAFSCGNTS
ncbi:MAG: hypothetical protein ACLTZY_09585 [Alistipes indistinctus]